MAKSNFTILNGSKWFSPRKDEVWSYQLHKVFLAETFKALLILVVLAALVGGFLAWKVIEQKQ